MSSRGGAVWSARRAHNPKVVWFKSCPRNHLNGSLKNEPFYTQRQDLNESVKKSTVDFCRFQRLTEAMRKAYPHTKRFALSIARANLLPPQPLKKRNLSTKANCVFLRPFGVFHGFSGFLGLKTGFRAATQLFRSPFFLFSGQKCWCTFGVSLLCKEHQKRLTTQDLNPEKAAFKPIF